MLKKDDLSALSCSCDFMLKVIIVWNFSGDKRHTVITGWEYLGIDDKERREQNLETITITPVSVTDKPKGSSKIYPGWTIQTTEKQLQMVHNLRMVRKLTHSLSLSLTIITILDKKPSMISMETITHFHYTVFNWMYLLLHNFRQVRSVQSRLIRHSKDMTF